MRTWIFLLSIFLMFAFAMPAFAKKGVTIHEPELATKMTREELDWMKKKVEEVYPAALDRVVEWVGTEKVRKTFDDFHVMIRDSKNDDPGILGWSVSYVRIYRGRMTTRKSRRQCITLFGQPFITGTSDVYQTLLHEMIHVAYEKAYGSIKYSKLPKYVVEGKTYWGAGQMDRYVRGQINYYGFANDADEILNSGHYDRLRYLTFLYCFERQYGEDARKQVLLEMFKGKPYKKVFEAASGDKWKKVKKNCKNQLRDYINELLAGGESVHELKDQYYDAYTIEKQEQFIKDASAFLESDPDNIWAPSLHYWIAVSLYKTRKLDPALEYFEKIRTGKVGGGFHSTDAAYDRVRLELEKCDCEAAKKLKKEYERLYPSFWQERKKGLQELMTYHCMLRKGQRDGPRTYFHENGKKESEGRFQNDRREGLWTWWYENGQKKEEGNYENDNRTGTWTQWHDNGQKKQEGEFVNGDRQGIFTWWHDNGQVSVVAELIDNKHEDFRTYFHDNGKKKSEGDYIKGDKDGSWTFWHENGTTESEGKFDKDEKAGGWTYWFDTGQKKENGNYIRLKKEARKNGKWTYWYFNGNMKKEGAYKSGQKDGHWTWYFDNGKKEKEGDYETGDKQGKWVEYHPVGTVKKETEYEDGMKKDK